MSAIEDIEKKARREKMREKMNTVYSTKIIRAVIYEEGMEDGFIDRYYDDDDVEDDGSINTSGIGGEHKIEVPYIDDNGRYVYVGHGYMIIEEEYPDGRVEISSLSEKDFQKKYMSNKYPLMKLDVKTGEIEKIKESSFSLDECLVCPIDYEKLEWISSNADEEAAISIGKCNKCNALWKFIIKIEEASEEDVQCIKM